MPCSVSLSPLLHFKTHKAVKNAKSFAHASISYTYIRLFVMWKFILANFPFPIWFDDNPYLLARFFSEQLNGATVPVLQVDNSGAYGHGTNQEATAGSCEVATECRQEDTKNLRTHVSA